MSLSIFYNVATIKKQEGIANINTFCGKKNFLLQ